jgi:predicted dehydrogenase
MISEFHLRAWNRIHEVRIVALANRGISRAEERRDLFAPAARVYTDLASMLASEQLDFVDILTPPELHYEHCLTAMAHGLHTICQKPLCENLERARDLVSRSSSSDRKFAVHENHRYRPWFRKVRALCEAEDLGKLRFVRIEHLNATEPAESYKNQSSSGVWLEYGSHLVDMMRGLLGEPARVHARMHRVNRYVKGESLAHATFEYPDCTAVIEAGWKHAAMTQSSVLVCGDAGEAWYEGTLTRGDQGRLRVSAGESTVSDVSLSPLDEYVESFYLLQREFIDAVLDRRPLLQTAEEHLKTLACTFAAYDSARLGETVAIRG